MKMKKLLAGILSATMVATMIPASMAFSSVSAEVPEALATYDLTTDAGREDWVASVRTTENVTNPLSEPSVGDSGVIFTGGWAGNEASNGSQSYTIDNPLKGNATNGFSVVVTVAVSNDGFRNAYESMFNFNGSPTASQAFFNVSGNGGGLHLNEWGTYWDYANGSTVDLTSESQFVLTVTSNDTITLYKNGVPVNSHTVSEYAGKSVVNAVNDMNNFALGAAPETFGQASMTFSAVSFYTSALTGEQVAELSGVEPEEVTLLNEYDLTTVDGRTGWTASSDEITENENGVTFTTNGQNGSNEGTGKDVVRYSITNPYLNSDSNTMTIVTDVKTGTENIDYFATLYGFYNNSENNLFGLSTNGRGVHWNYTESNMDYYDVNTGATVDMMQDVTRLVMVVGTNDITIYANGKLVSTITNSDRSAGGASISSTAAGIKISQYFVLGQYANNWWLTSADSNFKYVAFYTGAMTAEQVEENYAQSIADTLNLTMRGMQQGTFTPAEGEATLATRFVANLNSDALANDAITMLGWAAEADATTEITNPETATYAPITTVTNDSALASEGTFAYTYVVTDGAQTGVVPCVQVTVGGNAYWFSYNGYSGSLESTAAGGTNPCQVVAAIEVPNSAFASLA